MPSAGAVTGGSASEGAAVVVAAADAGPWSAVRPVARPPAGQPGAAAGSAAGVGRALMLLLDTNVLIDVLRGGSSGARLAGAAAAGADQCDHLDRSAGGLPHGRFPSGAGGHRAPLPALSSCPSFALRIWTPAWRHECSTRGGVPSGVSGRPEALDRYRSAWGIAARPNDCLM